VFSASRDRGETSRVVQRQLASLDAGSTPPAPGNQRASHRESLRRKPDYGAGNQAQSHCLRDSSVLKIAVAATSGIGHAHPCQPRAFRAGAITLFRFLEPRGCELRLLRRIKGCQGLIRWRG